LRPFATLVSRDDSSIGSFLRAELRQEQRGRSWRPGCEVRAH